MHKSIGRLFSIESDLHLLGLTSHNLSRKLVQAETDTEAHRISHSDDTN